MSATARARLDEIARAFARDRYVTRETRKGFGSGALKVKGKIFAMVSSSDEFVVKLPRARAAELVESGVGAFFEPGPGRLMKEWLAMRAESEHPSWLELAREARAFVGGKK
jgi:TfoX/Sxy family transcriptional regulator of competence genes